MTTLQKDDLRALIRFVREQVDTDKNALRWTTSRGSWKHSRQYPSRRGVILHTTGDELGEFVAPVDAEHAVRWQPNRVRVLLEANLNLIEALVNYEADDPHTDDHHALTVMVLQHLALSYADHPDYREEWKL